MSNENFWTDERVIEFEIFKRGLEIKRFPNEQSISESIEQFKASKQVKEWEVVEHFQKDWFGHIQWYDTITLQPIDVGQRIKSIKRLSDGEVFVVGDMLNDGALDMQIGSIRIEGAQCILSGSAGSINLMDAKKKRIPLFSAEGGKFIYLGDTFFIVHEKFDITEHKAIKEDQTPLAGKKYFSASAAAEEYVKLHQPKYSLTDFQTAYSAPLDSPLWNETVEKLMNIDFIKLAPFVWK